MLVIYSHRRSESGWEYPNLVGHRSLCFQNQPRQSVKEGTAGTNCAREYNEDYSWATWHWKAAEWNRAKVAEQISSALDQHYSMERRFQRNPNMKGLYQQWIDRDIEKGFVKMLHASNVKSTFVKERFLPHQPVLNPNNHFEVKRVCKVVCLNEKLLARPDLLHRLLESYSVSTTDH